MKASRRTILSGTAAIALAISSACGGGQSDLERARQDLVSWSGSLALAADQWGRGLDPTPFTRTVGDAAREALRETAKTLASAAARGDASAVALQGAARRLEAGRQALEAAIARRDGPAAVALAGDLESLRRSLRSGS